MGWLDALTGIFGDIGSAAADVWGAVVWLYGVVQQLYGYLVAALNAILGAIVSAVTAIGQALSTFWNQFVKGIFARVWKALQDAHDWLEAHLGFILKWLQRARQILDRIYNQYIRPVMILIQHIRQFLVLLKLMGVKWAAALDAKLLQIETDIARAFLEVRSTLTQLINAVNVLLDPSLLLRRPQYLIVFRTALPAMVKVATGLPFGYFFPSPRPSAKPGMGFVPANFTPGDPKFDPPASAYLGYGDGISNFTAPTDGTPIPDGAVDDLSELDYFDALLYPASPCGDPAHCWIEAAETLSKGYAAT